MAKTEEQKAVLKKSEQVTTEEVTEEDSEESYSHKSTANAIAAYRKIKEGKKELTEKEQIILDKECKVIKNEKLLKLILYTNL